MTTTAQAPFDMLQAQMRGPVIQPADAGYDTARAVYNAMIDRRPAAIARCADVADVMTAVKFAGGNGQTVTVRGGGHNAAGLGVWDDALVIDLSTMRGVTVDPADKTVRAEGGCVWGDVDHATGAFGLATPSGFLSTTGVGGLTLGGGIGYLARRYGLTVDNLLAADVVLADGSFVTASEDSHPDLFWALRGGGGNFGVVTSFLFRCHDVGTVLGGPVFYDLSDMAAVMRWYRELQPSLPEELSGWLGLLDDPAGAAVPGSAVAAQGGRHRLVLHRAGRACRRSPRPGAVVRHAAAGRDPADAVPGAAERVRCAVPGRPAVVLAGRLLP